MGQNPIIGNGLIGGGGTAPIAVLEVTGDGLSDSNASPNGHYSGPVAGVYFRLDGQWQIMEIIPSIWRIDNNPSVADGAFIKATPGTVEGSYDNVAFGGSGTAVVSIL